MGDLPQGWCECKISDICEIYTGNSINVEKKLNNYNGIKHGNNYIATKDISFDNSINYDNGVKIPDNCGFKIAPAGATLLCIEGGSAGRKIGYTTQEVCFGNKLCAFASYIKNDILSKIIYFHLQSSRFKSAFSLNKNGLIGGVSVNKLKSLACSLPPLAEQQRIVEKIEELFSDIDVGVKNLKNAQLQVKRYRQSVLKSAFEGKLHKYNKQSLVALDKICIKINDGTHFTPTYTLSGVPFISVKDIRDKKIYFDKCKYISEEEHSKLYRRCNPTKGDVLITKSGTIGRTCVINTDEVFSLFVSVALLKPKKEQIKSIYLMYALDYYIASIDIKQDVKGGVIKNLHIEDIKKIEIFLPTLPEQQKIVEEIEKRFAVADELEKAISAGLADAEKLKQSILKKAFSGQLVPQNPNDEPASNLLKRIKAEKDIKVKNKKGRK